MSFSIEAEKEKFPFPDVEIIHEQCKFTTTIYVSHNLYNLYKLTFSGIYSKFKSFLLSI